MSSPTFQIAVDAEGGHNVIDMREGFSVAWRGSLEEAAAVAAHLNACYPAGTPAPAWDSLVHEVVMERIGGEPVTPLHLLDAGELGRMVPNAIGGPLDPGLWRPVYDDGEVV